MPEFDNSDLKFMELVDAIPDLKSKIKGKNYEQYIIFPFGIK